MGKLGTEDLKKLLSCIKRDAKVIIPPLPGFDSGVHLIDDKYLVVSTDPCVGVPEKWFGWFLVHYAASDVALFGARPEFCTINLLGPKETKPQVFYKIMKQTCKASDELKMSIVTGHTGTYEGLSALVGVCTAYGTIHKEELIAPDGAKPRDYVLCVKPFGLETVINFALTHKTLADRLFGSNHVRKLAKLVHMQSCVREALELAEIGGVHAMHDMTEGGLTAALNEMAEASKCGFRIDNERIIVQEEVYKLKERFRLSDEQFLSMSSTGTILAAISPEARNKVEANLRENHVQASIVGVFTKDPRRILMKNGKETAFPKEVDDPYRRILSGRL